MRFEPSALLIVFAVFLGLWPLACVVSVVRHSISRRWRRVAQAALLLPLWTIAASVGLVQVAPFLSEPSGARTLPSPFVAAAGLGFALCCAAAAWWLLIRTFSDERGSP
jgi:hypothetical protein